MSWGTLAEKQRAELTPRRSDDPAVELRKAAVAWYLGSLEPAVGSADRVFKRIDRRLQRAARRFAAAPTPRRKRR